jgi:uncharacterized protein YfaQ (DUF2300 family)
MENLGGDGGEQVRKTNMIKEVGVSVHIAGQNRYSRFRGASWCFYRQPTIKTGGFMTTLAISTSVWMRMNSCTSNIICTPYNITLKNTHQT